MPQSTDKPSPPLTLNADEVAHLLGISKRTVYRLLDAGDIPSPIKIGRATRWRRSDIELFVEKGTLRAFHRAKSR